MPHPLPRLLPLAAFLAVGAVLAQEAPPGPATATAAQRADWPNKVTGPGRAWKDMELVGVAKRQRGGVDFYLLAMYVDLKALRVRAGEGPWTPTSLARVLSEGGVPLAFHAKFLRGVGGKARRTFLAEALSAHWPGGHFPDRDPRYERVMAYFGITLLKGETTEIWTDGQGELALVHPDPTPVRIQDRTLEKALLESYFLDPAKDRSLAPQLLQGLPGLLADQPAPRKPPRR